MEFFGQDSASSGGGIMVCGSPFETANDPSYGKVFQVMHRRDTDGDQDEHREHTWLHLALTANDQLRQRVAWAMAQILVIAEKAISIEDDHSEAFLTYYDIFTRNAFGNYRDLLEAITYSPAMGFYLTYMGNEKANPETGSMPDENYAREILQLFSVGLLALNMDGSVQTYSGSKLDKIIAPSTGNSCKYME